MVNKISKYSKEKSATMAPLQDKDDSDSVSEQNLTAASNALPIYLTRLVKKSDGVNPDDIFEDECNIGVGCDSDDEMPEVSDLHDASEEARMFNVHATADNDGDDVALETEKNFLLIGKGKIGDITDKSLRVHIQPDDWTDPLPMLERNKPFFKDLDNPGQWSSFSFQPVYKKKKGVDTYKHHCLPTGYIPVEENVDGSREEGGWKFYYQGWKVDEKEVVEASVDKLVASAVDEMQQRRMI